MRATADRLSEELLGEDSVHIETSDLPRASESASILQDELDIPSTISERTELRERNFGVLQGLDDPEYRRVKTEMRRTEEHPMLWAPERGESWRTVESRMLRAWETITAEMDSDETRLLVSHTGPLYCVLALVNDRRLESEMDDTNLPEASIYEIKLDDTGSRLRTAGWAPNEY